MSSIIDLGAAINEELSKYSDELMKDVKIILEEEAENLAKDIQERAPKRSKRIKGRTMNAYSKGWASKKVRENNLSSEFLVANRSQGQLSHLLEKGFSTRSGGRVAGQPHIAPAEEEAKKRIIERIEGAVSKK